LELRIIPSEARAFQAKVETTTSSAGGKLLESAVSGEDLTRQTIDADASLNAKRTLRDRLQALLEHRDGRLADLLAVERALSEAQQELDSATGTLAELRQRVAFSKMIVSYRSEQAIGSATARPLADAWANATTLLSQSLATLLTLAVVALPWALVLGGLFFAARAWRRRSRAATED
jgi:chromosome segregation ATPase